MAQKISLLIFGLLLSFRLLQAQPKPVLPYWNCPEEKSKKAQKMDAVMYKAIEKRTFQTFVGVAEELPGARLVPRCQIWDFHALGTRNP